MRHFGICLGLKPGKKAIPIGKLVPKGLIYVERIELHSFIPMEVTSFHIETQETTLVYSSGSMELDDTRKKGVVHVQAYLLVEEDLEILVDVQKGDGFLHFMYRKNDGDSDFRTTPPDPKIVGNSIPKPVS